jgi:GMP synthase PP-ATPase subunit
VVGEIRKDKLETLKRATVIAEEKLAKYRPNQYFAAIINNTEKPPDHFTIHIQEVATRFLNVPKVISL